MHKVKRNPYDLDLFISLVGERVTIEYGDDKSVSGVLKFVTRYEISLSAPEMVIIPKHSIKCVVREYQQGDR